MTTAFNLDNIDVDIRKDTQSFFTNTFLPPLTVSQNVDDAVIAYFQKITDNKESAKTLAATVLLVSVSQGISPMEALKEFGNLDSTSLNDYATMFLNLNRVNTSLLGLSNSPQASKYISRMIRP